MRQRHPHPVLQRPAGVVVGPPRGGAGGPACARVPAARAGLAVGAASGGRCQLAPAGPASRKGRASRAGPSPACSAEYRSATLRSYLAPGARDLGLQAGSSPSPSPLPLKQSLGRCPECSSSVVPRRLAASGPPGAGAWALVSGWHAPCQRRDPNALATANSLRLGPPARTRPRRRERPPGGVASPLGPACVRRCIGSALTSWEPVRGGSPVSVPLGVADNRCATADRVPSRGE